MQPEPAHTHIRTAGSEDFDAVYVLLRQLWPQKELRRELLGEVYSRGLRSQEVLYLCAVEEGIVTGFCSVIFKNSLWLEGYLAYIQEMIVDASHRRSGIGTALLHEAETRAAQKGCKRLELDSSFHRTESHLFYEHAGFEKRAYLFSKVI